MMKKLFFAAMIALLATPLFASEFKFDAKFGYARAQGGANGFNIGPGFYWSLMEDEDSFLRDLAVGGALDFELYRAGGVSAYRMYIGPELRLEFPYSFFKFGVGYDWARTAGANGHNLAMKVDLAGFYPITDTMNLGLNFGFRYTLLNRVGSLRAWSINIGPVLTMDI